MRNNDVGEAATGRPPARRPPVSKRINSSKMAEEVLRLMVSVVHYRAEARRCRDLAEVSPNQDSAARWRKLARDYITLADDLEKAAPLRA